MKKIITTKSEKFLENYLNNASPTGFETPGQQLWLDYIKPYIDDYITDAYGSVAGIINPGHEYKVVIEAHADEISWFVHYITEETPSMKNIFLDCGCSNKEEVEKLGVHVGCVVTFEDEFLILNKNKYVGRALDNRVGGFMIAEVARLIKENKKKLPFTLFVVNSVQEEIGLRGAEMMAHRIKPNLALITDVCHDTGTPMVDKIENGDQQGGKGPVLTYGPAVQNNFLRHIIHTAQKAKIPFQRAAVSRSTGTDTDAFAYSNEGVTSALISLPLRYMHTTVEMVQKEDVENCIRLIYETILGLQSGQDFRAIK